MTNAQHQTRRAAHKKSKLKRMSVKDGILIYLPVLIYVLLCLIPFIALLSSSFTDSQYLKDHGVTLFPVQFNLSAYETIFMYPVSILKAYGVSILTTVTGTVLNMILSIMIAYPISRSDYKYRNIVSFFLYISMIFNAGLIPTYIWYRNYLHIFDTFWVLILPSACIVGYVFLLRVFFTGVPMEIVESAQVDGASEYRILWQIASPLIMPGIATVAFYTVLYYWNDPNYALYYTENVDLTPISLYMARISNYLEALKWIAIQNPSLNFEVPEDSLVFATAIVTCGPMLFVFTLFQKYFVQGLTSGGVKG